MKMDTEKEDFCAVHLIGNFLHGGGVMMLDRESVKKIRCFVCGRKVDLNEIVVMSLSQDDMVCVCKRHLKYRYPHGTFDNLPRTSTRSD